MTAAIGLLATDMVHEYVTTSYQLLSKLDAGALQAQFDELEAQAKAQLDTDGIPADRQVIQRIAECRYAGQGYELRVDVGSESIGDPWVEKLRADFHDTHEREYSRRFEDSDIEVQNIRVRGIGLMPELETQRPSPAMQLRRTTRYFMRRLPGSGSAASSVKSRLNTINASPEGREPDRGPGDPSHVRLDDSPAAWPGGDDRHLRQYHHRDR